LTPARFEGRSYRGTSICTIIINQVYTQASKSTRPLAVRRFGYPFNTNKGAELGNIVCIM